MERVVIPELLDSDAGSAAEIEDSLEDLRWINRWFGGIGTTTRLLETAMQRAGLESATLLSVASGDGYAVREAARRLNGSGLRVDVVVSDRSARHLRDANGAPKVAGEAGSLPFPDGAFDFVECSLFAHHLEPEELVAFGREALRVGGRALLVNDLRRSRAHLAFVMAGYPLYRSRLTRHDAVASVRRAYTPPELERLLARAGAREVCLERSWFFRMGAIAWKS